jgi:uncharacterized FlaG/YvyC family protein
MGKKFKAEKHDNKIKIFKTAEGKQEDKKKLIRENEEQTIEELIKAIKKIANKVDVEVEFSIDKKELRK